MTQQRIAIVCPAKKFSGGGLEILRLKSQLEDASHNVSILIFFDGQDRTLLSALFLFPFDLLKLLSKLSKFNPDFVVTTHFSTLLITLFLPRSKLWSFVQGLEWYFPSANKLVQATFKFIISSLLLRSSLIIFANSYLQETCSSLTSFEHAKRHGLVSFSLFPVGSVPVFRDVQLLKLKTHNFRDRKFDLAFVLRKGHLKNIRAYLDFLGNLSDLADIPLEIVIFDPQNLLNTMYKVPKLSPKISIKIFGLCPQLHFFEILLNSKFFLLLSTHEGLGLPPLEAMAHGCIPLVKFNGGSSCYMNKFTELHMAQNTTIGEIALRYLNLCALSSSYLSGLSLKVSQEAFDYLDSAHAARLGMISNLA